MSTRYLKNRHFNASLKNIAVWGYWTDVGTYGVGTKRQGAPYFEALTGQYRQFYFDIFENLRNWSLQTNLGGPGSSPFTTEPLPLEL